MTAETLAEGTRHSLATMVIVGCLIALAVELLRFACGRAWGRREETPPAPEPTDRWEEESEESSEGYR